MNGLETPSSCRRRRITGALRKVKRSPKNRDAIEEALGIERFFRSGWYGVLTGVDGEYLIRKLQEEIRQPE